MKFTGLLLLVLSAIVLGGRLAPAATIANPTTITIPASGTEGPADPYPSTINVAGLGLINSVTVDIFGLTHSFPDDIDILLVSPSGVTVFLMSDAGTGIGISGINVTFDDAAPTSLPDANLLASGAYRPTNHPGSPDTFAAPAPAGPYGSFLALLIGSDPNGVWSLYVNDDVGGDTGAISGGWALNIDAASQIPEPATTAMVVAGLALCAFGARRRKS